MATMPGRFWNEAIETLSPDDRRRLENERLTEQIAYDAATSPFFRARLEAGGIRPDQVRTVEDLARIPLMEKAEIAESQADGTLLGVRPSIRSSGSRPPAARPDGRCGSG
jgi:phenylacetate-CoA ligase